MSFPKWCDNPEYLPTINELESIANYGKGSKKEFIHENPLGIPFQVLNRNFIEGLSKEIFKLTNSLSKKEVTILEVGAGNGRLSYFLKKELTIEKIKKSIKLIATDDFSWHNVGDSNLVIEQKKLIEIKDCNVQDSLSIYEPTIVISSWMPDEEDWTEIFRNNKNIESFILIGNPYQCGTDKSWESCNTFNAEQLDIKGNICWQDPTDNWGEDKLYPMESWSKVMVFKRK